MAATMTSIAREADVSIALVSRLLRGDATLQISKERRRRILEATEKLGGVKRRRKLSQVIVAPINRKYSMDHVQEHVLNVEPYFSFSEELKRNGFRIYFDFVSPEQVGRAFHDLVRSSGSCDGTLILSGLCTRAIADELRSRQFPHVSYDLLAERYRINTVHPHMSEAMARAVEHLQSLGHRRIGYFGERNGTRRSLIRAALAAADLLPADSLNVWVEPLPNVYSQPQLRDAARDSLGRWLDEGRLGRNDAPTALICSKDYVAMGAVDALHRRGLIPGRDLSLVGYENLEVRGRSPVAHPILTTIDNPADQIGRRMAQFLLNQILHGQAEIVHERLPVPLIVRESTGKPCPESHFSKEMQ